MKYLKIFFIHIFITCCFFITSNIYATQISEDLSLSRIYVEPGNLEPEFSETRDYYTLLLNPDITNLIVQATPTNHDLKYKINRNENLKEGENLITITVYSKDNSKNKIYTILLYHYHKYQSSQIAKFNYFFHFYHKKTPICQKRTSPRSIRDEVL